MQAVHNKRTFIISTKHVAKQLLGSFRLLRDLYYFTARVKTGGLANSNSASWPIRLPEFRGKVLVFGSAPGLHDLSFVDSKWTIISCNASQVVLDKIHSLRPHWTIFGYSIFGDASSDAAARSALQGCNTDNLIIIHENFPTEAVPSELEKFSFSAKKVLCIPKAQLSDLSRRMFGRDLISVGGGVSTGMKAVILALGCGAKEVVLAGFSLKRDGHSYNHDNFLRKHILLDQIACDCLARQRYNVLFAESLKSGETVLRRI